MAEQQQQRQEVDTALIKPRVKNRKMEHQVTQLTSSSESADFYELQATTLKKPQLAAMISSEDHPSLGISPYRQSNRIQNATNHMKEQDSGISSEKALTAAFGGTLEQAQLFESRCNPFESG